MDARHTILIADDEPIGRLALEELLLAPEYDLAFATNGPETLVRAAALEPDLVLLDVMMPGMDGFEVCRRLRATPHLAEVPIIMVTTLDDQASRLRGIEAGADDFISKPINRHELQARVRTITRLNRYRRLLDERARLQRAHAELVEAYDATIAGWARALDLRDKETEGHSYRVTELTTALARGLEVFSEEEILHIRRGALLHDIGKLGVPDGILLKPGKLTDEEWVVMKRHPVYAFEMLSPIAYLQPAIDIPYCHHEKWDGTGYPRGLRAEEIPLAARLFAIVDVWDALRSDRTYRPAWPVDRVVEHIKGLSGTHFDPELVPRFMQLLGTMPEVLI